MKIDKYSETWEVVVARAKAAIAELLLDLERSSDHATSEKIRGRIMSYRDLLTWKDPVDAPLDEVVDDHGLAT